MCLKRKYTDLSMLEVAERRMERIFRGNELVDKKTNE